MGTIGTADLLGTKFHWVRNTQEVRLALRFEFRDKFILNLIAEFLGGGKED